MVEMIAMCGKSKGLWLLLVGSHFCITIQSSFMLDRQEDLPLIENNRPATTVRPINAEHRFNSTIDGRIEAEPVKDKGIDPFHFQFHHDTDPIYHTFHYHEPHQGVWYKKLLPSLVTVVKFFNENCATASNMTGICMTQSQCLWKKGIPQGKCANGYGTCCLFIKTCGDFAHQNGTHFVSPGYPNPFNLNQTTFPVQCDLRVYRIRYDVCQLRLDFEELDLAGSPDCQLDRLAVPSPGAPLICGRNTGQHVYIDFPANVDYLTIPMTFSSTAQDRRFNIRISQVLCASPSLAPSGCLQYYTLRSGIMQSFNYGDPVNNPLDGNSGYPPNANYGICIRKEMGFCSIRYTRGGPFMVGSTITDGSDGVQVGLACQNYLFPGRGDFLVIPNSGATPSQGSITSDRYCGDNFNTIESRSMPFFLQFISDGINNGEGGFRINYEQLPC